MRVQILSPYAERLLRPIAAAGDIVVDDKPEFIVCYGHRKLIAVPSVPAVNLHISYLPWNRGADPNFWSWFDDTPKGITILQIDKGIDTGPVLRQERVAFEDGHTLASSYWKLREAIEDLFAESWPALRIGMIPAPQRGRGSYHRLSDKEGYWPLLSDGWNTPVTMVRQMGLREQVVP